MEEGLLGAVIAAVVTSVVLGGLNVYLQRKEHRHATKLQQDQWAKESEWRREDQQNTKGLQIHAQDAARTDQRNQWERARADRQEQWQHERETQQLQREQDKQVEREAIQRETMRELEIAMPSFSGAARAMYEWGQVRYAATQAGEDIPEPPESFASEVEQFNKLRYSVMGCIARTGNEKLRRRALHLFNLNEAMGVGDPAVWAMRPRETFGG
jgi:hypothetical protein